MRMMEMAEGQREGGRDDFASEDYRERNLQWGRQMSGEEGHRIGKKSLRSPVAFLYHDRGILRPRTSVAILK